MGPANAAETEDCAGNDPDRGLVVSLTLIVHTRVTYGRVLTVL